MEYLKAEEVVRFGLKRDQLLSVSTVYRVLAQLAEAGTLRRGLTPDGKVAYVLLEASPTRTIPMELPQKRGQQ